MATYHFTEKNNAKEAFSLFCESINAINEYNKLCKDFNGNSDKFYQLRVHMRANDVLEVIKEIETSGFASERDYYNILYTDKTVLGDIFIYCKNHCYVVDYNNIAAIEDTVRIGCYARLAKAELLEINKKRLLLIKFNLFS